MANRFKCLKPTNNDDSDKPNDNKYRGNRFNKPKQVNSRWQRSKSPEKRNAFTNPPPPTRNDRGFSKDKDNRGDNRNGNRRFDKGGFGRYRYNRGRKGPSVFDNVKKDNLGRPMLANATTSGFDIGLALQKQKSKPKQKDKKNKKKESKEEPKLTPFKKQEDVKTEEELKAEAEWNKQMILNMQYEWETESEEEEEDDHDPMTPNTDLV